jgi:MFS family permease
LETTTRRCSSAHLFTAIIYFGAFATGAIVMSFEMLGSRYLNPFFGSGIYTWAALISTVLAALTAGYFLGGFIADRTVSAAVLGAVITGASIYLVALPSFAESILSFVFDKIDNIRLGSLYSSFAIMFLPVTLFGVYSPFAIRLVLRTAQRSGMVSGAVYGVSTAGSIVGTLGTTFFLIPVIGTRAITLLLGLTGMSCGRGVPDRCDRDRRPSGSLPLAISVGVYHHCIGPVERLQSASAGPGELLHVAISLSASLPIQIVPPGQVTETSFSPAAHKSSHWVSHAVSVIACKSAVPAGPGGPSGPGGPVGPTPPAAPAGPGGPAMPTAPASPFSPCGPGGPAGPCGPAGPAAPGGPAAPCGPWAPSKHPASEKAAISATAAANARIKLPPPWNKIFKPPTRAARTSTGHSAQSRWQG